MILIEVDMKRQIVSEERCESNFIHQDSIDKVKQVIPSNDELGLLADFFKVFGDQTRIKILSALSVSELCVCDIAFILSMTQSAISHQLRVLKQARLVKSRKEGKVVYYMLDDDHVKQIIGLGLVHVEE